MSNCPTAELRTYMMGIDIYSHTMITQAKSSYHLIIVLSSCVNKYQSCLTIYNDGYYFYNGYYFSVMKYLG